MLGYQVKLVRAGVWRDRGVTALLRVPLRMKALMFVSTFVRILIVAAAPESSVNSLTGVVWQAALASILQYHTVNMLQQKIRCPLLCQPRPLNLVHYVLMYGAGSWQVMIIRIMPHCWKVSCMASTSWILMCALNMHLCQIINQLFVPTILPWCRPRLWRS